MLLSRKLGKNISQRSYCNLGRMHCKCPIESPLNAMASFANCKYKNRESFNNLEEDVRTASSECKSQAIELAGALKIRFDNVLLF